MPEHRYQVRDTRDFLRMVAIELRRIADLEGAQLERAMNLRHVASQCENEADQIDKAVQDTIADQKLRD